MTAAITDRDTQRRNSDQFAYPVAANTKIYGGTMVGFNAGYAIPGDGLVAHQIVGVSDMPADNTAGAAGAITVHVLRRNAFRFANSAGGDLITLANIGQPCYGVDDSTVALTSNTNTRPVAGEIVDVDSIGVWVYFS